MQVAVAVVKTGSHHLVALVGEAMAVLVLQYVRLLDLLTVAVVAVVALQLLLMDTAKAEDRA
jgi:hypothetical protein